MTKDLTLQKAMAFMATDNPPSALRAAGWTPSDLRAAGWTLSDLRAAGWTPSDLRAAGWTLEEVTEAEKLWESIPVIYQLYSRLLAAIEAGERIHDQKTWGPECDPATNVCKTPMCTAGHLVNMAGEVGYKLKEEYGWERAARMIHFKSRPDAPAQNYGTIPQQFAMAYIRERAAEETAQSTESSH